MAVFLLVMVNEMRWRAVAVAVVAVLVASQASRLGMRSGAEPPSYRLAEVWLAARSKVVKLNFV
ncbi:hypothetical protein [Paraburkholderia bryophila]|uniref:Anti-sigma-K factor RskA n=1 Tax=Paraburkholderia bryophila TaxID=420952 RepID=A0A7Y9WQE0_9BURK|nr:hypothetical protein [Paraburkholderia bryophila]NYH25239.1 anti-sigma-K factor RskA [Paraburkholderia bryophila]